MKSLAKTTTLQDFLQDANDFLEGTLAQEKLSRRALEHRTRLIMKVSCLLKEYYDPPSEMYIDMTDPTLKSFFASDSSTTTTTNSTADSNCNISLGALGLSNSSSSGVGEDLYEVPASPSEKLWLEENNANQVLYDEAMSYQPVNAAAAAAAAASSSDLCDNGQSISPMPIANKKTFLYRTFLKPASKKGKIDSVSSTNAFNAMDTVQQQQQQQRRDSYTVTDQAYNDADKRRDYDDAARLASQEEIYADISAVICKDNLSDEDLCLAGGGGTQNGNDSDGVSLKSVASEYSPCNNDEEDNHLKKMPASQAQSQAVFSGLLKRRNGKKILSAWRHCYAVLLPSHLLLYSSESDSKPKIIMDMTRVQVSRLVKQGMDTRRLKMQPFIVTVNEKTTYEMSCKSRDDSEAWIAALQARCGSPGSAADRAAADDNDDQDENVAATSSSGITARVEAIQGRILPLVPPAESVYDAVNVELQLHAKMPPSPPPPPPPPAPNDQEQLQRQQQDTEGVEEGCPDEIYSSLEDFIETGSDENFLSSANTVDAVGVSPALVDAAMLYDIPPSGTRPLSDTSGSTVEDLMSNQFYDVPVSVRRVSIVQMTEAYDSLPIPTRQIDTGGAPISNGTDAQEDKLCSKSIAKIANFWQTKLQSENNQVVGTKSIGRSFNRPFAAHRPILATDELKRTSTVSSSSSTCMTTSSSTSNRRLRSPPPPPPTTAPPASSLAYALANLKPVNGSNIKKERPPRPPAPLRVAKFNAEPKWNTMNGGSGSVDSDVLYKARWQYVPQNALEVSMNCGEMVQVICKSGPNWLVRIGKKKGLVPKEYLLPVDV